MQLTGKITPDSLMTLEAYAKWRKVHKPEVMAHRQLRTVRLGDHLSVQFESEFSMRYQIQEMLRSKKSSRKRAFRTRSMPMPRWYPMAATGRPRCCWSTPTSTSAGANWPS